MKKLLTILFLSFLMLAARAQDGEEYFFDLGAGYGINYGSLGLNVELEPYPYISIDLILGYNFEKNIVARGVGLSGNIRPLKHYNPCLRAFYGFNGFYENPDIAHYGFNIAFGHEFKFGENKRHGFALDLIAPLDQFGTVLLGIGYKVKI